MWSIFWTCFNSGAGLHHRKSPRYSTERTVDKFLTNRSWRTFQPMFFGSETHTYTCFPSSIGALDIKTNTLERKQSPFQVYINGRTKSDRETRLAYNSCTKQHHAPSVANFRYACRNTLALDDLIFQLLPLFLSIFFRIF